jgi:hypothetical protein
MHSSKLSLLELWPEGLIRNVEEEEEKKKKKYDLYSVFIYVYLYFIFSIMISPVGWLLSK